MKYWHEVTDEEYQELMKRKLRWDDIPKHYKQPDWCALEGALLGGIGCWSLTSIDTRQSISREFCKDCDYYLSEVEIIEEEE